MQILCLPGSRLLPRTPENPITQRSYAFEIDQDFALTEVVAQGLDSDTEVIVSPLGSASDLPIAFQQSGGDLTASLVGEPVPGVHSYDVTLVDEFFNTTTINYTFELFANNESPQVSATRGEIVTGANPFESVTIDDDGLIQSTVVQLSNNYPDGTAVLVNDDIDDNISIIWDETTGTITLTGEDTAEAYTTAVRGLEVYEPAVLDPIDTGSRTSSITVNDVATVSDYEEQTTTEFDYQRGAQRLVDIKTWDGDAVAGAKLFGFSDTDLGQSLNATNFSIDGSVVRFDIVLGAAVQSIPSFSFNLDVGDNFIATTHTYSETVTDAGFFTSTNTVDNSTYYVGIDMGSNPIGAGDEVLTVELRHIGQGPLESDLGGISFNDIALGSGYEASIDFVSTAGVSNSLGIVGPIDVSDAQYDFVVTKDEGSVDPSVITAYDAYLTHKISMLPVDDDTIDGITFVKEQIVAADYNQNGRVNAMDVVELMREVVHITNDSEPSWDFIHADSDLSEISAMDTSLDQSVSVNYTNDESDQTVYLTAILRGDVDGSWMPPDFSS